ncbi:MAG: hypothetical protein JNM19_12850 [Chitinophagaceae bacterium]|nr:hypothetical protein [Chitinophagaceae bacterium]
MSASSLDIELSQYWSKLTPVQKESILSLIRSFTDKPGSVSIQQYNQELAEAEEEYKAGNHITSNEMLQLIKKW